MPSDAQCKRALDLHEDRLSGLPGVVGLGIIPDKDGRAVAVYVLKKLPPEDLAPEAMVPEFVEIPARGKGKSRLIRTRVLEQGPVDWETI